MSRTEVHRPYFVQMNEGTDIRHRHYLFGRPVYASHQMLDENGKPVMEVVFEPRSVESVRYGDAVGFLTSRGRKDYGHPLMVEARAKAKLEAKRLLGTGPSSKLTVDYPVRLVVARRHVLRGVYAAHCTVSEPARRDGTLVKDPSMFAPCGPDVPWADSHRFYSRSRAEGEYDRYERRGQRRAVRARAQKLIQYRDFEDLADVAEQF